jgi:hypothetical protein
MAGFYQSIQDTKNQVQSAAAAAKPKPPTAPQALGSAATSTPYAPGVSTYATNPSNDLRGQTIVPGQMADRNQIAQNQINTWNASSAPQYQADVRSATSQAAGGGQLGSGQLRTSLGNLAYNRDVQRNAAQSNYLSAAQTGSIDDAYKNIGIAQQQQQFQAGLQNQTFNQGLQALQAGSTGNPTDTQLALSGIYSNNANNASNATSNLIGGSSANAGQQSIQQILQGLYNPTYPSMPVPTTPTLNDSFGAGYYG